MSSTMTWADVIKKFQSPTFCLALLGLLKTVLQSFGIVLPTAEENALANGIAGVFILLGVYVDHSAVIAKATPPVVPIPPAQP